MVFNFGPCYRERTTGQKELFKESVQINLISSLHQDVECTTTDAINGSTRKTGYGTSKL